MKGANEKVSVEMNVNTANEVNQFGQRLIKATRPTFSFQTAALGLKEEIRK